MRVKIPRRHILKPVLLLLAAAAVIGALLVLLARWENNQEAAGHPTASMAEAPDGIPEDSDDAEDQDLIYYQGSWYAQKKNLETVLLMGVDKFEANQYLEGYYNTQQADFLLLLVLDNEQQSCSVVQINRDTMTDITILGINGKKAGTKTGQLALAHTYGSGNKDSCENTVEAVSGLLYGAPVDHYVSVTMDAVQILNDLVGGVTVTVLDDFSGVDDSLVKGQEVTLLGEQALTYVRTRKGLEDSTNLHRMERQQQYLTAFRDKYEKSIEQNPGLLPASILEISPYMVSDCTVEQMLALYEKTELYDFSDILTLEGEAVKEDEYMAFYPDEDFLRGMVMELFYDRKEGA